jgi:FkbM family methyltransferase
MTATHERTLRYPSPRNFSRIWTDTAAVLRVARPASAGRWLGGLAGHLPAVVRGRSLRAADRAWASSGARFRTPSGRTVTVPGPHTAGAREMYCRNVYLRTGLRIPAGGWVVDLGANAGLFTVLAAVEGARVLAVEVQQGFVPELTGLLAANRIEPDRVAVEVAMVASDAPGVALVGVVADDARWQSASHATGERPARTSVAALMERHRIDRIGLLKMDIEGSEFSLLHPDSETGWLRRVDQVAMEVHPDFGDVAGVAALLAGHGLPAMATDNDGRRVAPGAPSAAYLYAVRPVASQGSMSSPASHSRQAAAGDAGSGG